MAEALPDRLCVAKESPHWHPLTKKVGMKFNGKVIFNCYEYCMSEGWVKLIVPQRRGFKTERGRPVTVLVRGTVEPYWR